jgi:hypothetical protein
MKASELRIGNWVYFASCEAQDGYPKDYKKLHQIEEGREIDFCSFFEPITLTEEWLLKFDFDCEELKTRTYWTYYQFKLIKGYKRSGYPFHLVSNIFNTNEIRYVHELQNLHFSLFGKELELK